MDNEVRNEEGFFNTKDHLRMFWRSAAPKNPAQVRAHVLVLHGFNDHSGRYKECLRRLAQEGFHVHAFDCRGHGQSDGRRAHCDSYRQYEDDLSVFLDRVRSQLKGKKLFGLGHANGGLIYAHYELTRPPDLSGIVFTAPFLGLAAKIPLVKRLGANLLATVVPWLPFRQEIEPPMLSHDPEWVRATDRDPLYTRVISPRCFFEALKAQEEVRRRASELVVPSLVLTAGADPVVSTPAAHEFFERMTSKDKQYKEYPGMFHEILMETGKDQVYGDLVSWLNARA